MRLDDEALRTVFRCFDMDHSGGIDLNELHSAISLLGIPHMSKQKVEKMFADADEDGNGEIDFDEFRLVVEMGDGGQLAKIIEKVATDQTVREIMKQRCRPTEGRAAVLSEQLARVKEEREWFNRLHLLTVRQQVQSAHMGYVSDRSIYVAAKTGSLLAEPASPQSPRPLRQQPSPPHQLTSARAARPLLPTKAAHAGDELEPLDSPQTIIPPSMHGGVTPRGHGLRRIFGTNAVTDGLVAARRSPRDFGSPPSVRGSPPPAAHALAYHSPRPGLPVLAAAHGRGSPRAQRMQPNARTGSSHEASPRRLALPAVVDGRSVSQPTHRPPDKEVVASW